MCTEQPRQALRLAIVSTDSFGIDSVMIDSYSHTLPCWCHNTVFVGKRPVSLGHSYTHEDYISARFLPADRRFGLLGGPILLRGTKQATGRPAPWEAEALLAGARVCWEAVTASREAPALERPREARRQAPLLGGLKRLAAG